MCAVCSERIKNLVSSCFRICAASENKHITQKHKNCSHLLWIFRVSRLPHSEKLVLYKWFSCCDIRASRSRLVSIQTRHIRRGLITKRFYGQFGINEARSKCHEIISSVNRSALAFVAAVNRGWSTNRSLGTSSCLSSYARQTCQRPQS